MQYIKEKLCYLRVEWAVSATHCFLLVLCIALVWRIGDPCKLYLFKFLAALISPPLLSIIFASPKTKPQIPNLETTLPNWESIVPLLYVMTSWLLSRSQGHNRPVGSVHSFQDLILCVSSICICLVHMTACAKMVFKWKFGRLPQRHKLYPESKVGE